MRKKTCPTILERAISLVPEFKNVLNKLDQQVTLRGQSKSTLSNYGRRIALFVIHFQCLPHQVSEDEINEYLASLARDPKSPSRSSFKHFRKRCLEQVKPFNKYIQNSPGCSSTWNTRWVVPTTHIPIYCRSFNFDF